ncbi:P-loop containing nucleoside triphosphate hydrolase protein, partial [Cantharellus anzutake]|uniref:P-loop containing nucleoside triphosphate hydrolase protein n=1 Tax=Cantharellus anzutake TaxID=1750568 RepID=UPI001905D6CD
MWHDQWANIDVNSSSARRASTSMIHSPSSVEHSFEDPVQYQRFLDALLYKEKDITRPSGSQLEKYRRVHDAIRIAKHDLRLVLPSLLHSNKGYFESIPMQPRGNWLGASQYLAVSSISRHPPAVPPLIISSPPGTGETTVLITAVLELLQLAQLRILICTHDQLYADDLCGLFFQAGCNVLNYDEDPRCSAMDRWQIQPYPLVVTTCLTSFLLHGVGLPDGHFTHVFLPTAQEIGEPEAMIPLKCLTGADTRVVLLGDPFYGRSKSSIGKNVGIDQSYFQRLLSLSLYSQEPASSLYFVHLTENYTLNPKILNIVNMVLYSGRLAACGNPQTLCQFDNWSGLNSRGFPIVAHHTTGVCESVYEADFSVSFINQDEATRSVQQVMSLLDEGFDPTTIGIISTCSAQCQVIKKLMESQISAGRRTLSTVKIGTWETYGHELRDVIIVSTVVREYIPDLTKKFNDLCAFNVIMTRARSLLIVFGDRDALRWLAGWREFLSYIGLVKSL